MIFKVGKTYRHTTGKSLTMLGYLDTYTWGNHVLIAESSDGELIPVGETEEHSVNWAEVIN